MKHGVLFCLALILAACHKEPEVVDVNKVVRCAFSNKSSINKDACVHLNDAEKMVLACFTSTGKSKSMNNECKDISFDEMQFYMQREPAHAKQRGTQFKLSLDEPNK